MIQFCSLLILCISFVDAFNLQENIDTAVEPLPEQEPCDAGCQNGGQCFLSSFCICPKGYSGRYCEIALHEQCGTFSSMTTIEINCVLCICYNGLFTCDIKPMGLCRQRLHAYLTRSQRIHQALNTIRHRYTNIHSFQPMVVFNFTLHDRHLPILEGYRIVLNHSSSAISRQTSRFTLLFCFLSIYLFH